MVDAPPPALGDTPGVPTAKAAPTRRPTRPEAARFLNNATFGATRASVAELVEVGSYDAWLDRQFSMPAGAGYWSRISAVYQSKASFPRPGFGLPSGGEHIIPVAWEAYVTAADQLRKRVGAALLAIFVINERVAAIGLRNNQFAAAAYLDMLEAHAFGNFRDLLEGVTRSPAMGHFLSHIDNERAAYGPDGTEIRVPDENYAREILQLFTIGLHELDEGGTPRLRDGQPIETYDQSDIFNLARVFTGFVYDDSSPVALNRLRRPMRIVDGRHAPEAKQFLGLSIPPGTPGDESLRRTLDHIVAHPNVGPFIGRQLIQRLVTSNPSPAYVARVARAFADDGRGVRGDMKAVVRAVLTDEEALGGADEREQAVRHRGKVREPMIRVTAVARALGATSRSALFPLGNLSAGRSWVGQTPVNAPSVFNYFRPGYAPPGSALAADGLVAPELQICSGSQVFASVNFINQMIADSRGILTYQEMPALVALSANPQALVQECILLLTGQGNGLAEPAREAMVSAVAGIPAGQGRRRVIAAMQMVASSMSFLVQH